MVHATTMTLVMAEKDPPVFRDFLGMGRKEESSSKQPQPSAFMKRKSTGFDQEGEAETSARASPRNNGRFETLPVPGLLTPPFSVADPGSEGWMRARAGALQHHGVKSAFYKPETVGRESLQERLQMSLEALENSRPLKVARLEQKDDNKAKFRSAAPTMDELRLSMQPPRPSKGLSTLQTTLPKPELSPRMNVNKLERSRTPMNGGVSTPIRISQLGVPSERPSAQFTVESTLSRENFGLPPIHAPAAADEGSRTGIKGSGLLAGLQQGTAPSTQSPGVSGGPSPTSRRPKVSTHNAGSDSLLPSRQQFPTPSSRQLTIFYGGQAHVFDDVPPDKANQIMQLAGSNGRSWSTTYSPRQTTSIANSASEGSLSAMEREKTFNLSRGGSASAGNLALSSEVQTLLRGLAQSGAGRGGQGPPSDAGAALSSMEAQNASLAEHAAANGTVNENLERRALMRPGPFTEDSVKEASIRGQRWT